jgi:hypothetical protein
MTRRIITNPGIGLPELLVRDRYGFRSRQLDQRRHSPATVEGALT